MTLAIMQPYLFPYIGYWQLINAVDTFVIYDNIQFSKKHWFNRNNILLNNKKTLFSIPLKKDSDNLDVFQRYLSCNVEKDINRIIRKIEHSYKKAPYFNSIYPIIRDILLNKEKNLFIYIFNSIKVICKYLDIEANIIVSSTIDINHTFKSENKVITINKKLNTSRYINSIGGMKLYNREKFKKENIDLMFLETEHIVYKQFNNEFIPNLSIIDVLMFNSKDEVKILLKRYKIV